MAETLASPIIRLFGYPKSFSVKCRDVAEFMAKCVVSNETKGLKVYENLDIHSGKLWKIEI